MYKLYFKVDDVWEDITDYIISITGELRSENIVDFITCRLNNTIETELVRPEIGDDFKLEINSVIRLSGYVNEIDNDGSVSLKLEICSYSGKAIEPIVNEFISEFSAEGLINFLVTRYLPDFTFIYPTDPTNYTFKNISFVDKKLIDCFKLVCDTINYVLRFDENKNIYLERKGSLTVAKTLTVGTEIVNMPKWTYSVDDVVNSLILEAGTQRFGKKETIIATADQEEITLKYIPVDISITLNGTLLSPEVEGTLSGDYIVDAGKRKIKFNTPLSESDNVLIDYSYDVSIKVRDRIQESVDFYKILKEVKINKPHINTFRDARKYARTYLDNKAWAVPKTQELILLDFYPEISTNSKIRIIDNINKQPINAEFLISEIILDYPKVACKLTIGQFDRFLDNQHDIMEKIKDLETNPDNFQFVQKTPRIDSRFKVKTKISIINQRYRYLNDSFVPNHPENGMLWEESEAFVIDDFDDLTNWTVTNGNKTQDSVDFVYDKYTKSPAGNSLKSNTGSSTSFWITNSSLTLDLSSVVGVTTGTAQSGCVGVWVKSNKDLISATLRIGHNSSNYCYINTGYSYPIINDEFIINNNTWTYILFPIKNQSIIGNIDWTNINYLHLRLNKIGEPAEIKIDFLTISKSDNIGANCLGDRRGEFIYL